MFTNPIHHKVTPNSILLNQRSVPCSSIIREASYCSTWELTENQRWWKTLQKQFLPDTTELTPYGLTVTVSPPNRPTQDQARQDPNTYQEVDMALTPDQETVYD